MTVRKERHIADLEAPTSRPLHPENLRIAFELSEACMRLAPQSVIQGVRRYRSIEDANSDASRNSQS
ncbi:MAG: hypothetical protein ACRDKB_11205 [Actinomycetota bacterium]